MRIEARYRSQGITSDLTPGSNQPQTSAPFVGVPDAGLEWELPLSDGQFNYIRGLAMTHAGIEIADYKKNMVRRRISKRLRVLGYTNHRDYCEMLGSPAGEDEIQPLINALTTNKTEFFREYHHFQHMEQTLVPKWVTAKEKQQSKRLRIWSAGCSTGQEPYSIAMSLSNAMPSLANWDAKILATDIDTDVLDVARHGVYGADCVDSIPAAYCEKYLEADGKDNAEWRIAQPVRSLLTFRSLNLHGAWPMRGPFDLIFCRNVVIYFDKESQRRLFDRFAELLPIGGLLYCGHSESLFGICSRFRAIGKSIYEKVS